MPLRATPPPLPLSRADAGLPGLTILGPWRNGRGDILTEEALAFVVALERRFRRCRSSILESRAERQADFDQGALPDFLESTRSIRESDWTVAPIPADLQDRRVEITGPVDPKMIINALNSGAQVFMADFEDSTSPTWENVVEGQHALRAAVRGTLTYFDAVRDKEYRLDEKPATLLVRPRGWHLEERHVLVDGKPVSASLFDFGLFFFHNTAELLARGSGPYFYLPKLESHHEARLWNAVFLFAQESLGIARGTIKATVLIETIPAAFEMDEILFELREHAAGLNCGRWDYIFSTIKKLRRHPDRVLPDRDAVGMTQPFLRAYSKLLIQTCHRRGAHAIGGMAAQIPVKDDPVRNLDALDRVRADKRREALDGHDGTWVAHPALVPIAAEEMALAFSGPHQKERIPEERITAADLLAVPEGPITEDGLRKNLRIGIQYLEAWLRGRGCVPLEHLMEDAATAEISRAQLWQWREHGARLEDGRVIDEPLLCAALQEELAKISGTVGPEAWTSGRFELAARLFEILITAEEFEEFLTLPAYEQILSIPRD